MKVFRKALGSLPAVVKALQRAGVTRLRTWILPTHSQLTYLANFKIHVKRLRQVAKILARHDLRLGIEYVAPKTSRAGGRFPFIHTMAETAELISAIDNESIGFALDSWHWYHAGEPVIYILSLKNHVVVAVDINDAPANTPIDEQVDHSRELPMATGVIDLAGFLNALSDIGYDGPVRAEPFNAVLNAMPAEMAVATTSKAMRRAFELIER